MFKEPEKHTVIGIVKTKMMVDSMGDEDDILETACGENEEVMVNFKAWAKPYPGKDTRNIMVVEQDNVAQLQELCKRM